MNGTRRDIRPEMNSTSRDSRSSLATTIEHLRLRATSSASASCGQPTCGSDDRSSTSFVDNSKPSGSPKRSVFGALKPGSDWAMRANAVPDLAAGLQVREPPKTLRQEKRSLPSWELL